jgi:hypothetical protein
MRKKQLKNRTIAVAAIFFVCTMNISAQVTIGKLSEPHAAAVLDLSQKEAAAPDRGLLLPRVSLTDPDVFQLIADADDVQKSKAAGMVVYNLGQCDGKFAQGVYAWTGTKWVQLTKNPVLTGGSPVLTFNPALPSDNIIRIPSGQDARPAWTSAYNPGISYTNASSVTGAWANTIPNTSSGLVFSSHLLEPTGLSTATTVSPYSWTTSPISISISIWPEEMTSAEVAANPFLSRESKLTIKGIANAAQAPCQPGSDQTQEITLNQTNYAIVPGSIGSPVSLLVLRNIDKQSLPILSNARWQAADNYPTGGTVPVADILDSYTDVPTGSEMHDGSSTSSTFQYRSTNPVTQGKKYETAQITFSDVKGHAKPVTITVVQCQGTPDMSSVTKTATPEDTEDGVADWDTGTTPADKVVRHLAKPVDENDPSKGNIYEEFYSAKFGDAGRWMTTNLAAWKYDEIKHSTDTDTDPDQPATGGSGTPRTLTGPNANSLDAYNTAYWCYPNGGSGGSNATDFTNNPHIGFLYTWDAATAGKGGDTGQGNTTNESNMAETTTNEAGMQQRIQGICPKGWHLPSDREWNELEKEIYTNPQLYSYYTTDKTGWSTTDWKSMWETTTDYRPPSATEAHGKAMKEICGVNSTYDPNGRSKSLADGGFNILLPGYASSGSARSFGYDAFLWSSSSSGSNYAWLRYLYYGYATVSRYDYDTRRNLFSVRCKKD